MENHPAHTALPVKAKSEAMDVLNWAWTGMPFFRRCSVDANFFFARSPSSISEFDPSTFHSGGVPGAYGLASLVQQW